MKNVLFIESGVYGGGSFVSLVKHLNALDRDKINPVVVFFNDSPQREKIQSMGIKTYLVKDPLFSKNGTQFAKYVNAFFMKGILPFWDGFFLKMIHNTSVKEIQKLIKENAVDRVHLNTEIFRDRVGLIAAAELGIPVISHLRSKYDPSKIGKLKSYIRYANAHVSQYIGVSEETKKFWSETYGIHQQVEVLYDYFEPYPEEENIVHSHSIPLKILCPANLVPVKGHPFLIRGLQPFLFQKKLELFLAGKGEEEYERELKELCQKLEVVDEVHFLGFRKDIQSLMKEADVIMLASEREGMPNVIIEAMGIGSLVVATAVGGIPEIIQHGKNGFLINDQNEIELQEIIQNIIEKNVNEKEIRQNAKQTVAEKFSKSQYQLKIKSLYE